MPAYKDFLWEKYRNHELWLQYCPTCQKYVFYPREYCPGCLGSALQWRQASGQGVLYSYTVVRVSTLPEFVNLTPYLYALVELDEGVRMASNLVDYRMEDLRVGIALEIAWRERGDRIMPVFHPLSRS